MTLLSALGEALQSVAAAAALRTGLERPREGPDDAGGGRDALAVCSALPLRLQRLGNTQRDPGAEVVARSGRGVLAHGRGLSRARGGGAAPRRASRGSRR